jgi:hypothetical protein
MLGYSNRNKDPIMGLQILKALREKHGKDWRLLLIGHAWDEDKLSGLELEYYHNFCAYLEENNLQEAVEFREYVTDVPAALQDVGFTLSCSWREGTHEAVLEGMASGAIPVIRRWPMVRQFGAPETAYPGLDCFDTAEEAADLIGAYADKAAFKAGSEHAVKYAAEHFDQKAVYPQFSDFIRTVMEETDK